MVCDSWMMEEEDCIRGSPAPIPSGGETDPKTQDPTKEGVDAGKPTQVPAGTPTGDQQSDQPAGTTEGQQTAEDKQKAYG